MFDSFVALGRIDVINLKTFLRLLSDIHWVVSEKVHVLLK